MHRRFTFKRIPKRLVVLLVLCLAIALPSVPQETGRKLKTRVEPAWPPVARKFNISGTVRLQVTVAPSGEVTAVKVIGGHPVLVDPAMAAVHEWRYEPAPRETVTTVEIKFSPGA